MKLGLRVVLLVAAVTHYAVASPNAADLEKLLTGSRISHDIIEDARLDGPDLILKYGYPLEIYEVTTEDGYILEMHRIPHGRDNNNDPNVDRPTVFVQHGLFSSSADWINMGPGCALGYLLAEEGYDVWMGNARGNYYSRKHIRFNPNGIFNSNFWSFSWEQIGEFDLPAMIDKVLEVTGKSKIHYIGHSQGTTAFFVMASVKPEYNEKIISMHALAPVAFMENVGNFLLRYIASHANNLGLITSIMGMNEFMPNSQVFTWAGQSFCMDEVMTQVLCSNILFVVGGRNEDQLNTTTIPIILGHTPAGASTRQLVHYGQSINDKQFRRYDYGWISNLVKYGTRRPPSFPLEKITTPVFLHYAEADHLADPKDVDRLFAAIPSAVGKFRVQQDTFSHIDFMWAISAKTLVWDRVITLMKAMDNQN